MIGPVEVIGVSSVVIGIVHVGVARRGRLSLTAFERARERARAVGIVDLAVLRRVHLIEVQGNEAEVRIYQDQLADGKTTCTLHVHAPHKAGTILVHAQDRRVVDPQLGLSSSKCGGSISVFLGHNTHCCRFGIR